MDFHSLAMSAHDLAKAVEFVPNRVFYVALRSAPRDTKSAHFFSIDRELIFWNFYLDFGPLNIAQTYRFCEMLHRRISDPSLTNKKIYFYSSVHGNYRANAVCLLTCWGLMYNKMTPEEAFRPFEIQPAFTPFHDATQGADPFKLTIMDCLKGLARAIEHNYFSVKDFNVDEYEHFEKVENGDLSWVSRKFIAFAGPKDVATSSPEGYCTLTPEHYIPYYKKSNVTLVIRLNNKCYDEKRFLNAGIDHLSLYYPDGSNAPTEILKQFIDACERTSGVVAVHCKAGLGRTGTCIGAYMMKHEKLTAREVIGWLRLARPGSVIGPQQQYLESIEQKMWRSKTSTPSLIKRLSRSTISHSSSSLRKNHMIESEIDTQGDHLVNAKRNQQLLYGKL